MNGSCPCNSSPFNPTTIPQPSNAQSWNDLQVFQPINPVDLIAWANIASSTTSFRMSPNFATGPWITSPFSLSSTPPYVAALGTDNLQNVADADQWNFQHLTGKGGDTTITLPLLKVIFLRGGAQWKNSIRLTLGGATYNDLQLSFRDNAATRGDYRGTIPVISFTGGNLTATITLEVVLKTFGEYTMGLRAYDGSNISMFEMEWIVVP